MTLTDGNDVWTQTTEREQEIVDHKAMTTLSNNEKVEHLD